MNQEKIDNSSNLIRKTDEKLLNITKKRIRKFKSN